MAKLPPLLQQLIEALRVLPGVGPKSAQRMALQLLERNRAGGLKLGSALTAAMQGIGHCQQCRTFSEQPLCPICSNPLRAQADTLCIVASAADQLAIEQTGQFQGRYFVLMGYLSPLDGVGPEQLGLNDLAIQLSGGSIKEVILATNPTVEGEATAFYLAELCRQYQVTVTRLAQGLPVGGELEYIDGSTLAHAFSGRRRFD